jgi:subtilase family serine protease
MDVVVDDNDVSMVLTILFPDLEIIGGIRHPSSMETDDIVTISAVIANDGEIEAREVIVTFYVDDKEVKSQTINLLPEGSSRLIPFTWQTMGGAHELSIKVDPEDAIAEQSEENNEKTKNVNVDAGGIAKFLTSREVCALLPIIIIVIILASIAIILKRRGSIFGWKPRGD